MRKVLLTSAGFENTKIMDAFLEMLEVAPKNAKALFVPTAANNADAILVLPKCLNDLINSGLKAKNISVYDLHELKTLEEISKYHVIYFCGGSTNYLLSRMKEIGFDKELIKYVDNGGIYIGVSAGSLIATNSIKYNLGIINCTLAVHRSKGSNCGPIDTTNCPHIELSNSQAIIITSDQCSVIE